MSIKDVQLKAEDLWVTFHPEDNREHSVLKGMNFTIYEGEILGLMGRSGCGKTVTAMTIMGLVERIGGRVTEGKILYKNEKQKALKDLLTLKEPELIQIRGREIAMISQNPVAVLNPVVPVGKQLEQTIAYYHHCLDDGLENRKDYLQEESEEILGLSGLAREKGIRNKYPNQLSVGMCQRVAIGLGICGRPKLLIADEPTASLDYGSKDWVLEKLLQLRERLSMSILLITHDRQGCNYMADRIINMQDGSIGEGNG